MHADSNKYLVQQCKGYTYLGCFVLDVCLISFYETNYMSNNPLAPYLLGSEINHVVPLACFTSRE